MKKTLWPAELLKTPQTLRPKKLKAWEKRKAVIYLRVLDEQFTHKTGDSIRSQKIECEKWAKAQNIEIEAIFYDDLEVGEEIWKGLQKAFHYLHKQNTPHTKVPYLITYDVGRMVRPKDFDWALTYLEEIWGLWTTVVDISNMLAMDIEWMWDAFYDVNTYNNELRTTE